MDRVVARNNAELCDIVCRTHGIVGAWSTDAWTSPRRTPEHYPDAVTLEPGTLADRVLAAVDSNKGCSVKDSFATLDLAPHGFRVLFSAEWIHRAPTSSSVSDERRLAWAPVGGVDALVAWEAAWSDDGIATGRFLPALLGRTDLTVLAGSIDDAIVAGAIVNRSDSVVGISNVFATAVDGDDAWAGCLHAVAQLHPGRPIVGYESGAALEAAHRHGFASLGPLRVWIR